MMNFLRGFKQGWDEAREHSADRLDQKVSRKALRDAPESPVMIAKVNGHHAMRTLRRRGWEIRSFSDAAAKGTLTTYLMEKPNPNYVSH